MIRRSPEITKPPNPLGINSVNSLRLCYDKAVNHLAQYLGAAEKVPLSQRLTALEAQVNELKVQFQNLSPTEENRR